MDTLCFSHLRWDFVYQRPQHLLSRVTKKGRVFYIEEPLETESDPHYTLTNHYKNPGLWIVNFYLPASADEEDRLKIQRLLIDRFLKDLHVTNYLCWYYTPMALQYSRHLSPSLVVYDCMDELSAFKFAPAELVKLEREMFALADIVFVGGATLYEAKKNHHDNIYLFPSSIDKEHFKQARKIDNDPKDQAAIGFPRLGFYGVIDERFDISLVDEVAEAHPDWQFVFIGPTVKIDPATLPIKNNIHYLGSRRYDELPAYLAGWDIALLPFARNESTRFISPTKTPEYLAGGKPVISTSIADVVSPYGDKGLVEIADTADEFTKAAAKIFETSNRSNWLKKVDDFLKDLSWDQTWAKMNALIEKELNRKHSAKPEKQVIYV